MINTPPIQTDTHTQLGIGGGAAGAEGAGGAGGGTSTTHDGEVSDVAGGRGIVVKLPTLLQGDSEGERAFTLQNQVVP